VAPGREHRRAGQRPATAPAYRRVEQYDLVRVGAHRAGLAGSPGCLPRDRPDEARDDRFGAFVNGLSDDGGRDDDRLSRPA